MPALNEIGAIASRVGVSLLSKSPIWSQEINRIDAIQLHAFIQKAAIAGKRDEAESALEIVLSEITQSVDRGEIAAPQMLAYYRPLKSLMTAGELTSGLLYLGAEKARAILFALEVKIDASEVAFLTRPLLTELRLTRHISQRALSCLASTPRHEKSPYVFWLECDGGLTTAMTGLDADVFDAFGLVWAELAAGYSSLIMIDGAADGASIRCFLTQ